MINNIFLWLLSPLFAPSARFQIAFRC